MASSCGEWYWDSRQAQRCYSLHLSRQVLLVAAIRPRCALCGYHYPGAAPGAPRNELRDSESDLLFAINRQSGRPAWLYVLLEHQSTPSHWMRFRLLKYCCRIWDRDRSQRLEDPELRPIVPLVFYQERDLHVFSERQMTHWRRAKAAFIFQAFALIPGLTAAENVDVPLRIAGTSPRVAGRRALEYLDMVGLAPRAHHRIYELSGGEQQRVAVARALVKEPEVLLADEPTGELDQTTGHRVLALLRSLAHERGIAICLTSHDPTAADFADEVYSMKDGELSVARSAA